MSLEPNANKWYALLVRSRWESSTSNLLAGKGYPVFLPTSAAAKRSRTSLREAAIPLFPGYVFCQFDVNDRLPVLVTPGVLSIVGRGKTPLPVEDSEIASLQLVVSSGAKADPCPYLEVGQRIKIDHGALSGLQGILTSFRGSERIVVSVSLLCRSVSLEIPRADVSPVVARGTLGKQSFAMGGVLEPVVA